MLKSFIDKIQTSPSWFVYTCYCCLNKKDKPKHRRQLRRKLKQMLKKEINNEI